MLKAKFIAKVVVVTVILAVAVYTLLLVSARYYPTPSKPAVCRCNIRELDLMLEIYAEKNGHYPHSDNWVETLEHSTTDAQEKRRLHRSLKCLSDTSMSRCSYEMNPALSGRKPADIPKKDREHIVMLREKEFTGSHGWVIFLNGHPERRK